MGQMDRAETDLWGKGGYSHDALAHFHALLQSPAFSIRASVRLLTTHSR